ncbi:MAG: hypothetical protein Q9218_003654 [Villophora microphyllina]
MSSRLLTMKFMQRAAASSPLSTPQSPTEDTGPPSKRRKTSSNNPSPIRPSPLTPDNEAFQAAADAEDAKRAAAIERIAAEAGETKWVLSTVSNGTDGSIGERRLRFLSAGYSEIDQDGQVSSRNHREGRRSFGRFNREIEKPHGDNDTSDSDSHCSTSSDTDEHEQHNGDTDSVHEGKDDGTDLTSGRDPPAPHHTPQQALTKVERKGRRKAEKAALARQVEDRSRAKEVKLSRLSSISGGGNGAGGIECHFCGQRGHKRSDCPRKARMKRGQKVDRDSGPVKLEY